MLGYLLGCLLGYLFGFIFAKTIIYSFTIIAISLFYSVRCINPHVCTPTKVAVVLSHESYVCFRSFNPRTHEGCDIFFSATLRSKVEFQSTHPRRVRLLLPHPCTGTVVFQSTHPRGVRHVHTVLPSPMSRFQSTHPRGVRPQVGRYQDSHKHVSIHAPTKGATLRLLLLDRVLAVSIHAPTKGATCSSRLCTFRPCRFNPRTHKGCDIANYMTDLYARKFQSTHPRRVRPHIGDGACIPFGRVSIHAPTKGATGYQLLIHILPHVSIHAPTKGATLDFLLHALHALVSIHAPTKGATVSSHSYCRFGLCFNPRTHEGCDVVYGLASVLVGVAIHAPTKGATHQNPGQNI